MNLRMLTGVLPAAMLSAAIVGCGGDDGPDLAKVKADFENPTGSVQDKQALVGVAGERNGSQAALAIAQPGALGGKALTASGQVKGFKRLSPVRAYGDRVATLRAVFEGRGGTRGALSNAEFEGEFDAEFDAEVGGGCENAPEARDAFMKLVTDLQGQADEDSIEAEANYSLDLASCSEGDLTGSMSVSMKLSGEKTGENSGKLSMTISMELSDVCETGGDKACVTGNFLAEMAIAGSDVSGTGQFVQAWDLSARWTEDGTELSAQTKGGVRSTFSGNQTSGQAKIEYLFYANASNGEEVSFVLEIEANSEGEIALKYKGSDGETYCTQAADGSGSCSSTEGGEATITWTKDEYVEANGGAKQ